MEKMSLENKYEQDIEKEGSVRSLVRDLNSKARAILAASTLLGMSASAYDDQKQVLITPQQTADQTGLLERTQTEAEKLLMDFPKEIPGAEKINIESVEGAKKVVVFVKQNHLLPDFENRENQKINQAEIFWELYDVDRNQRNIGKVVRSLKTQFGFKKLHAEMVTKKNAEEIKSVLSAETAKDEFIDQTISPYINYIFGLQSSPILAEKFEYAVGADKILHAEGIVDLAPAETEEGLGALTEDVKEIQKKYLEKDGGFDESVVREEDKKKWKKLFDNREDIFIKEIASKDHAPMTVVLFGYSHDFSNNIRRWNTENPDEKYSLVTIEIKKNHYTTPVYDVLVEKGFNDEEATWVEFAFRDLAIKLADGGGFDEAKFNQGSFEINVFIDTYNIQGLTSDKLTQALKIIKALK